METPFKDAVWIMADTDGDTSPTHRYYLYTASFDITADAPVTLYISAFSQYAVFVNGTFADAGVFEDYDFHPAASPAATRSPSATTSAAKTSRHAPKARPA